MKNRNKILSLLLLVFLTLFLVSCNRAKPGETTNITTFLIDGYNEEITLVDQLYSKEELRDSELSSWIVLENGTVENVNIKDGSILLPDGTKDTKRGVNIKISDFKDNEDGTIRTFEIEYTDTKGNKEFSEFKQYIKDDSSDKFIGYTINYDSRAITHHQGYSFDGSGLKVNLLNSNGQIQAVESDHIVFKDDDYHPRGGEEGKSYINFISKPVALNVLVEDTNNNELITPFEATTFDVRIAGGRAPIHSKTSSVWNWIFLQTPMAYVASFIGSITGKSLAWAIVFTTIIVRTLAWPIYAKTNDMSMKMALAQPDMDKVQQKYATKKDPESQQKMQMELMAVYKKHEVNMLGCFLPLLQMPIFLAMFQVVSRIAIPGGQFAHNVTHTKLFGIELGDAAGISWVNFLLAAIVGTTMFLLQKISAKKPSYAKNVPNAKTGDQAQSEQTMKMVSYFMIFMMVFASFGQRSLAFYWVVGNLYSIGQTLFNRYMNERKYNKMQEEKLYGKQGRVSRNIIDAKFTNKDDEK